MGVSSSVSAPKYLTRWARIEGALRASNVPDRPVRWLIGSAWMSTQPGPRTTQNTDEEKGALPAYGFLAIYGVVDQMSCALRLGR